MVFSLRDYVVTANDPGYTLVRMQKSGTGLLPAIVTDFSTWEEAIRKARLLALMEGVRAWASPDGNDRFIELVIADHEHAAWAGAWRPFDRETLAHEVGREPGIYLLGNGRPLYAGDTDDLYARLMFHLAEPNPCLQVSPLLFSCKRLDSPADRQDLLERLIHWWAPPCNSLR
ncbi:MAG TPA: hypothetical protein VFV78_07365 [Vicinamibacterales bacterium]|nr:hypothetical protein [Vicinamibacterales bacterium]